MPWQISLQSPELHHRKVTFVFLSCELPILEDLSFRLRLVAPEHEPYHEYAVTSDLNIQN